jgi:hypothetical protein
MTDIIVECCYGNCGDLDCTHFPKRICTLSDQIGILVCSYSSLIHYLKLIESTGDKKNTNGINEHINTFILNEDVAKEICSFMNPLL